MLALEPLGETLAMENVSADAFLVLLLEFQFTETNATSKY